MKKNVVILFGGTSNEHEVSLKSAACVIENMDSEKYNVILVGITKEGRWLRYYGEAEEIRTNHWQEERCTSILISYSKGMRGLIEFIEEKIFIIPVDVVFPVLHGKNGEDGRVQGLLELADIPFVGCNMISSAICMDKYMAHLLIQSHGIEVPKSILLDKKELNDLNGIEKQLVNSANRFGYPFFIKPLKSGSSIGISRVNNLKEGLAGVQKAFLQDDKVIIEENIEGFEVGCAILGNESLIIGKVDEIELSEGFFNYEEKYSLKTSYIHVPARISEQMSKRVKETAIKIYKILGCNGMSRVDLFVTPKDKVVFNEVNTIPGFTNQSRYPNMLMELGYSYTDIIDNLIQLALK